MIHVFTKSISIVRFLSLLSVITDFARTSISGKISQSENRLPGKFLCVGLLLTLCLFCLNTVNAQVLSLETTANKTDIFTREAVVYTFKYSCSGSTQNCTNVTMTGNFPANTLLITGTTTTSDIASYTISPDLRSITYTFKEPLPSGTTGTIEMTAVASSYAANNSVGTLTSSILSGGVPAKTNTNNVTIHSADKFCAVKYNGTGLGVDNTTTYNIKLFNNSANGSGIGTQSAGPITVVDQLPAGAIIESATWSYNYFQSPNPTSGTCSVDAANAKVTCNFPASFFEIANDGSPTMNISIKVKYPSSTFATSQTVTNTASVTYTPPGGSPIVMVDGSTKTYQDGTLYQYVTTNTCTAPLKVSDVLVVPVSQVKATKNVRDSQLKVGQNSGYSITLANTGNTNLANVVTEDVFPGGLYVSQITNEFFGVDNILGDENLKYWVKTKNNPTYTQITFPPTYIPASGDTLTAFKITADILHAGFSLAGIGFPFTVKPTSATSVQNCLTATSTTSGVTIDPTSALCASFSVLQPDPFAGLVLNKYFLAPGGDNIYNNYYAAIPIGAEVWMALIATADGGGQALQNPVIMDLLPKGADYAGTIQYVNGTPAATSEEVLPNYNGTGRTLVRLKWTAPMAAGATYFVSIKTKITNSITVGNPIYGGTYTNNQVYHAPYYDVVGLKNTGFITGTNKQCEFDPSSGGTISDRAVVDTYDLNGNGSTTDTICYNTAAQSVVGATSMASLESIKLVKGQLDANYSRYPASGNTVRGGKADYKLVVRNTGNVPMKAISVVDILPFVGDGGVIDLSPRNTAWRPNLAGAIAAPSGVTVYYSTAQNPCRDEMKAASDPSPFPTGCTPPNWTTQLPTDITTVQALKFDFGSIVLGAGDSLLLTWPMRVPVDAPANGEIAWNSFGFVATRTDNNSPLLAAEPAKVGIKLAAPAPAYYGDYVWYDTNHNGLQDAGEQGVDGVKVVLYKDNGDNTATPATDTEIAFTITGNGGKYLFPNLQPGNYYALFFPPASYSVSPANQGGNDAIDSDGTLTTYQGAPAYITAITQLDALEEDLTWDLGIYCGFTPTVSSNSPVTVGGTLSLSASGGSSYSWTGPNGFVSTSPNPTIPNVTTANAGTYKVTVDNNGCYASLTIDILVPTCVKPNAGADVRICSPATSAAVVSATASQNWQAQAGNPASATITQTGQITGMTANGTYTFILSSGTGCTDTVQVIRGQVRIATVTPGVCNTATNQYTVTGTVSLTNAVAGTLTITDGTISTTATVTTSTTAVSFSLVGQASGTGSHTITAALNSCGTTSTTYIAPSSCTQPAGTKLTIDKLVNKSKAKVGDVLTYTVVLTNVGSTTATNVVVRDSSTTGLRFLTGSATPPAGTTYTPGAPISTWTVGTLSVGQSLSLTFQAIADSSGILYNTATIPGDTAQVCTSVPVKVCPNSKYNFELTAPAGRSSYRWFRDGVELLTQTTNVLNVSQPGSYSLAVDNVTGKCPDFSCCPFIVEEDTLPTVKATAIPVTCIGTTPQTNGQIVLSQVNPAYTYQYSLGASFNPGASLSGAAKLVPVGGVIASNLANPVAAQAYTVRVYNSSGCFTDVTVMLQPTVCSCPPQVCTPFVIQQTKKGKRIGG